MGFSWSGCSVINGGDTGVGLKVGKLLLELGDFVDW